MGMLKHLNVVAPFHPPPPSSEKLYSQITDAMQAMDAAQRALANERQHQQPYHPNVIFAQQQYQAAVWAYIRLTRDWFARGAGRS